MTGGVQAGMEHDSKAEESRSLAEWVTLIVSFAILAGVFGVVIYLYVVGDDDPITIRTDATLDQTRIAGETYYVPVEVFNEGDSAAGDVQIQAELSIGPETETSEFSIVTLPANDSKTGIITFSRDPRGGEFSVRVVSYIE